MSTLSSSLGSHPGSAVAARLGGSAAARGLLAAEVAHLNSLPQGQPERDERTLDMAAAMGREVFGTCSNHGECEVVCPKRIPLEFASSLQQPAQEGE